MVQHGTMAGVWQDISPAREASTMKEQSNRFLAFVDVLGTRALYADASRNATLIEDRRHELEHAIHIRLQRHLAEGKIEIGIFSDTVLVAGKELSEVAFCAATLLDFVFRKTLDRASLDDIRMLRGGISRGIELRSSYLPTSHAVSTIPFYDGSLAFAYELENVRRGSRLFISGDLTSDDFGSLAGFNWYWKHMPGYGRPAAGVHELLWPALVFSGDPEGLIDLLHESFRVWRQFVSHSDIDPDVYRTTIYHFDETVKAVIRSFTASSLATTRDDIRHLTSLLPGPDDLMEDCNIRFIWGIWFQVILVLCRLNKSKEHSDAIQFTFDELKRRNYFDKFKAETDHADYLVMKELFKAHRR
jgi:hypothetical protein